MQKDYQVYQSRVKYDSDGKPVNNLSLDKCKSEDEKTMGKHLQSIAVYDNTCGSVIRIGEVYGFPVVIKSETAVNNGKEGFQNRFFVQGAYRYSYNNGLIAMSDTHLACMNFVNALEKLPSIIKQHESRLNEDRRTLDQLTKISQNKWDKEDELKQLKSQLTVLERKIAEQLKPDAEIVSALRNIVKEEEIFMIKNSNDNKWHIGVDIPNLGRTDQKPISDDDKRKMDAGQITKMELVARYLSEDVFNLKDKGNGRNNQMRV